MLRRAVSRFLHPTLAATAAPAASTATLGHAFVPCAAEQLGHAVHAQPSSSFMKLGGDRNFVSSRALWYQDEMLDAESSMILYPPPSASVGNPAPKWQAPAVVDNEFQTLSLDQFIEKGKYVVLFFYPKDWTFVCPTEIIAFSDRAKEFEALNAQVIAASTDTEESHLCWIRTPRNKGGLGYMQIPILADTTKLISAKYGVLAPEAGVALRGLFIINPEGVIEQITINNMPIGRSVDETLRLLQAIQYVKEHGEVCPANWKPGAATMVADPEKSLDYFSKMEDTSSESIASKLQPITSSKDYDAIVKSGQPVVIDFYAPWCGKCRQLGPFMDELVEKHPNVKFCKVDTTDEKMDALCQQLGVKTLPAFKFYKGGKEVQEQVVGYKKNVVAEAVKALA